MADDQNRISLSADELKALDLIISTAHSQGAHANESLNFITAIAQTIIHAVRVIAPVVARVVPVVAQVTPMVVGGGMAASQQPPQGGLPGNITLNDLIELRRRAS